MKMLSNDAFCHIISWTHDGLSFTIHQPMALEKEVLPAVFDRPQKFHSFLRKVSVCLRYYAEALLLPITCLISHLRRVAFCLIYATALPLGIFKTNGNKTFQAYILS